MPLSLGDLLGTFGLAVVVKGLLFTVGSGRGHCCCRVWSVQSLCTHTQLCPQGSAGWHCLNPSYQGKGMRIL